MIPARRPDGPSSPRAMRPVAGFTPLWILGSLAALLFAPPIDAQDTAREPPRWSLDARLGYATAIGDLGDLSDEGVLAGVGLSYRIAPRLGVRADVSVDQLGRAGRPRDLGGILGPQTDVWHLLGAAELELTEDDATPWSVWGTLGAGVSVLDVKATLDGGDAIPDQTEWKPTAALGMMVGYGFGRSMEAFGRSDVFLMLGDRTSPGEFLGKEAVVATSLGLRLSF